MVCDWSGRELFYAFQCIIVIQTGLALIVMHVRNVIMEEP